MSYQSIPFILFAAVMLLVYYLVPGKWQKYVLLFANLTFYGISGIKYLPFLLATMCITFFGAKAIGKVYEDEAEQLAGCTEIAQKKAVRAKSKVRAKKYMLGSLLLSAAFLVICKYSLFVLKNINYFIKLPFLKTFRMIVPLGISFYTFMAISYLLDIYWRRYQAEKSFFVYAVYLSYFPHIVQGPIDRFNEFKAQLPMEKKLKFSSERFVSGSQLAIWGFFQKLVIADRLCIFVNTIYDSYAEYTGLILMLATVVYSIQLYADFAGCINIVSGVSEMFGIKLKENFNHPYFSRTMPEFWRRWHISLGEWFKDYIYYPVSISSLARKVKKSSLKKETGELIASCIPVIAVWMMTGIWHGSAWKYVVWGMYHAILIVGGLLCEKWLAALTGKLKIRTECFSWRLWQRTRTFILCCIGRIFFRADSLKAALQIMKLMVSEAGLKFIAPKALMNYGLNSWNICMAIFSVGVLWVVDLLQERMSLREKLLEQNLLFRWGITLLGIFAVLIFGMYGPGYDASKFIYEQF